MFVYVNVIEDITAYFGVCDMDFFLINFEHYITTFQSIHHILVLFFCLFGMFQANG